MLTGTAAAQAAEAETAEAVLVNGRLRAEVNGRPAVVGSSRRPVVDLNAALNLVVEVAAENQAGGKNPDHHRRDVRQGASDSNPIRVNKRKRVSSRRIPVGRPYGSHPRVQQR